MAWLTDTRIRANGTRWKGPYLLREIASSLTAEFCISSANVAVNLLLFGRLLDGSAMLHWVRELISIPGYAV